MTETDPPKSNKIFEKPSEIKTLDDYKAMVSRFSKALGFEAEMSDKEWQEAFEKFMEKRNSTKKDLP